MVKNETPLILVSCVDNNVRIVRIKQSRMLKPKAVDVTHYSLSTPLSPKPMPAELIASETQ
jgi:hypothetical protein